MNCRAYLVTTVLLTASGADAQIQLGILDDFEGAAPMTCSTDNWTEGAPSPNPPTAELLCGELDTCCLVSESAGGFGPGSRQGIQNETQWLGDYITAGVNKIQMLVANASATETLHLRIGVTNGNSCFVSTTPVMLPPNMPGPAGLVFASFFLDDTTMTSVSGNACLNPGQDSLQTVLSNVTQLRIKSAVGVQWVGDAVISELQIDQIQSKSDSDFDGVNDDVDNCTTFPNPSQIDSNGDGFGNACDADLDNNCVINFADLGIMKSVFFMADADADLVGTSLGDPDGVVNFFDLARMKATFFGEPGPGLGACGACAPPDALGNNADFAGLQMFMRGGLVLDWGANPDINGFADQTGGLYVARFEVNSGVFEWKLADADWSIEYCTETTLIQNTPTNAPLFGCAFPANGVVTIPASGCYEFQMQTDGNVPPNSVDVTFTPAN